MSQPVNQKVLTLGYMPGGTGEAFPFNEVYQRHKNVMTQGIEGIDALVVWGGTDIHPSYYGQKAHRTNQQSHNTFPMYRDEAEWAAMTWAKAKGVPIIGVCRGAQMACAFSGGSLIQDVDNHTGSSHDLICEDGVIRKTNSCHHQMMYPWDVDHRLIAYVRGHSSKYEDSFGKVNMSAHDYKEPEIVFFPETRTLAIQGHPEWMDKSHEFVQYCLSLVRSEFLEEVEA